MKRWQKVVITHIDTMPPPELYGKSEQEIAEEMGRRQQSWPPVLVFEVECECDKLKEELMRIAEETLRVGVADLTYELEEAHWIGEA